MITSLDLLNNNSSVVDTLIEIRASRTDEKFVMYCYMRLRMCINFKQVKRKQSQ